MSEEEEEEEETKLICLEKCKEKQNDQDFKQKMGVASTLVLEFYRVLMGAFLIAFVPQKCGDSICSMGENMNRNSSLAQTAISFNALTMLSFLSTAGGTSPAIGLDMRWAWFLGLGLFQRA